SAIVGAGFVVTLQIIAIVSTDSLSYLGLLRSPAFLSYLPGIDSLLWWPARAALGDLTCLSVILLLSVLLFASAIWLFSSCWKRNVAPPSDGTGYSPARQANVQYGRPSSAKMAVRLNEWKLMSRSPWLASQILMQILYLTPPILVLFLAVGNHNTDLSLLV